MRSVKFVIVFIFIAVTGVFGQNNLLSKREAVDIALENNYDIRIAKGNVEIAENETGILNSGYLPSITGSGGANYNINSNKATYQDGSTREVNGAQSYSFNGTLGLNYTIFDGLGRKYNYERLKENYNLSELQARQVIENSILSLFTVYYDVARLTQNVQSQMETIEISRKRLQRAKYGYEYGQNTQLDVLNAEVDFNNDSIAFLNLMQELENTKRDLNVLLGRDVNEVYVVDTTIVYMQGLILDEIMKDAMKNNVQVLQNQSLLQAAEYGVNVNKASLVPQLGVAASYSYRNLHGDPTAFFQVQTSIGPSFSANLTWNIFDGGLSHTRIQNAKISARNQEISLQQTKQVLQRNVNNAWAFYQNALFILQAEKKNLETNQRNFERTLEQQKLGQITSIEFRQAQFNLLRAKLNFSKAKYEAKTAELALLQLAGQLMNAIF